MRLIYATSIAFSHKLANLVQVHVMAKEFQKQLRENFCLGINYANEEDKDISIICFNSRKSYVLALKYLKFIKEKKISHVYCREARLLFFIILFNKFFYCMKLKFVYEIHSLLGRDVIDGIIDKFLSIWVDNFIFITKNLRNLHLTKYSVSGNKAIVAPDSVDLKIFAVNITKEEARQKLNLPYDKKIIGYTGRFKTMDMDKGINGILKALKILNDPNILFVAIGGSEKDLNFYRTKAEKLRVQGSVKLIGAVNQPYLAIFQKACDALLMPFPNHEHYAYYMSPLKMFEYMASKRPIIASDLPSIREVLSENNAVIVKPDNPEDLARGIKKVLEDDRLSSETACRAFEDAKKYTWKKRVEKIIDFIEME